MQRIFVSFHFDDQGKALADQVQTLISSHGLHAVTGERLGGVPLADGVKSKIEACDALICLLTEQSGDRNTNWVQQERTVADTLGKPTCAVLMNGMDDPGMFEGNEYLQYDPNHGESLILALSETIGIWKREAGHSLPVLIEPERAAEVAINDGTSVRYRFWRPEGRTEWQDAVARRKAGGALIYLNGAQVEDEIEVELKYGASEWFSEALPQTIRIPLKEKAQ